MELLLEELKEVKESTGQVTLAHPGTGEPLFTVHSEYGRNVSYKWHPHMLSVHPGLENSWEHNHASNNADSKSQARIRADATYQIAARNGFKDKINTKVSYADPHELDQQLIKKLGNGEHTSDDLDRNFGNPEYRLEQYGKIHTFHDPDTDEVISTHSGDKHIINSSYLNTHGLKDSWQTLANQANIENKSYGIAREYHVAKKLYENKGKQPRLSGIESNKQGYSSFKVNTTPEDGSSAHEQFIRNKYSKAEITRHSPTAFTAIQHSESEHSSGYMINSHVTGNTLHSSLSTFHHPDYRYKDANTQIIESVEIVESID